MSAASDWHEVGRSADVLVQWHYQTPNSEIVSSTHTQSTASKLEQVANLLCVQAPTLSGTANKQHCKLRSEGLVWLIGAVVCLLAAPWVR